MSNDFAIEDDVYIILLKYFQGDVIYLKMEDIKSLSKGIFNGNQVPIISKDILKVFVKILKLKEKKPNVYRATNWIYPDWNQKRKKEELMKAKKIVDQLNESNTGLVVIDGKLIEKPVLREMQRKILIAEKINKI